MLKNPNYRYGTWALIVSFFLFFIVQLFSAYIELSPDYASEELGAYHLMYFPVTALAIGSFLLINGWWQEDVKRQAKKQEQLEAKKTMEKI
ncbi:hypothetical protein [Exiguobacterium sp. H66]|uniref:hypothetical protein n=1 Tax=Exiguobacterium sp. H66 TaxID=2751208 RepID=UPI001BE5DF54